MGRELLMHTKRPGYLGFMARKSAVNPGARFYARGLNDAAAKLTPVNKSAARPHPVPIAFCSGACGAAAAGAGNEMECEQLLVVDVNGASIVIKEKPFELVPLYWQRVATRSGVSFKTPGPVKAGSLLLTPSNPPSANAVTSSVLPLALGEPLHPQPTPITSLMSTSLPEAGSSTDATTRYYDAGPGFGFIPQGR
ncbi:hypothetical protein PAPYR_8331 [Paratrimastix pyriformis]|uniref:Uncharacterized protein n=1 Tax=Paratrimastix pyriformis TaxID=342808 RepID=A0ABQ8UAU9_9EUKA|nr:hypothetical protein PAPYR_8331 [Paratrimastix pyriformis]